MKKGRYRTLARLISYDIHIDKYGKAHDACYVVLPGWNYRVAIFIPSVPKGCTLTPDYRTYVEVNLGAENWEDLKPKWCK